MHCHVVHSERFDCGQFMMLLKAQDELNRDSGREDRVDRQTGTNSDGNARRDIEEGQEGSENSAGPHQATISTTYTNPGETKVVNGLPKYHSTTIVIQPLNYFY